MASEEVVLVVGGDITLDDLEADVEVGESPRGGNAAAEKSQDESTVDIPALPAFETQGCVFCVLDENDLTAQLDGEASGINYIDKQIVMQNEESKRFHQHPETNQSSCSETCHNSAAHCDDYSQESLGKHHSYELSPLDDETDSTKSKTLGKEVSMTGKRTCVTLNCDKQKLVSVVDSDCDCNEDHFLYREMGEFTHINGLHHVMKEAWGKESVKLRHMPSKSVTHKMTDSGITSDKNGCLSEQEDSSSEPLFSSKGSSSKENQFSDPSSVDTDRSGDFRGSQDPEIKLFVAGTSSIVPSLHRTVIDLQPGQIVHRNNPTLPEYSQISVIESLPEELLLNIFSYLTPTELCHYVAPVCHRWHDLAYEPTLWTCLKVDPMWEVTSADICKILDRVSGVRVLSLRNRRLTNLELVQYLRYCRHLTDLDLGLCDNVDFNVILCILKYCPLMKSLNVEGCSPIDLSCVKQIATLEHLCHLNLSHCRLENDSIDILAFTLDNIVSFNVDGVSWITDEAIIPLCENHRSTLKHLELDGEELTDKSIKAVSGCLGLRTLTVSFCDLLTDTSLDYLKDLKKLKKLRLRKGLEFSEEAVVKFFKNGHLTDVVDLDMSECAGMKDSSVLALTQFCGRGLVSLALRWCWSITDVGLISIVDHCSNLKNLDLTGLHRLSGECLERVPDDMSHLTFLDLRNCNNINDKLIYEMIRCKPDLQVINYYGELFIYGETTS